MFPKISPIIPVRRRDLFENTEWIYELKHDGFRALAYVAEGRCRLISRRGNEMKRFADLAVSRKRLARKRRQYSSTTPYFFDALQLFGLALRQFSEPGPLVFVNTLFLVGRGWYRSGTGRRF